MKKILIIFGTFLLTGCALYNEYKMPKDAYINLNENNYQVYSTKHIKDLISDTNVEIINNNEEIKTNKTGSIPVTIKYKFKNRTYKYEVNYTIMDTIQPILLYAPKTHTYNIGDEINDFCDETTFIDNYDRNVKCKVNGEYDVNTVGTYNLEYEIYDKSENKIIEPFSLYIIDPNDKDDDYSDDNWYEEEYEEYDGIQFSDIVNLHKTNNTMIGIDISRWQGDVDFKKIKDAGCEFVIMRIAVSNGPDDKIGLDSYYKKNIKNAKKAGLKVGVYVYTSASSVEEIESQAKFVQKELNKIKLDFPIAYDFESWSDIRELKVNTFDLINFVDKFYNIVHKDGYDVMLYSSKKYLEKVWLNEKYPVWLAHYTDQTDYQGKYMLWQMCSDGRIDGINGDVDIDIYYKN